MNQLLGILLISLPFIVVFGLAWYNMSFLAALSVFGTAAAIVLTITVGVSLLHG